MKFFLRIIGLLLCSLPSLCLAANDLLLDESGLVKLLEKSGEYQLLDARNDLTQRLSVIPFSRKYQKLMPLSKGLVLVVADSDSEALKIAQDISTAERSVYAVQGGASVWLRVSANSAPHSTMPSSFVIPMNTCEQGKPLMELKRKQSLSDLLKK